MAVLCQTLTSLAREKTMWLATVCICDQPQVLLQTGKCDIIFTLMHSFDFPERNCHDAFVFC